MPSSSASKVLSFAFFQTSESTFSAKRFRMSSISFLLLEYLGRALEMARIDIQNWHESATCKALCIIVCFPRLTSLLFNVSLDVSPTSPTNISHHFTAFHTARVELYPHPSSGADQFGSKGDRLIILDLNGNAVNDVFQKASVQSGKALGSLRVEKSRPAQHVFYAKHVESCTTLPALSPLRPNMAA